MKGLLAIASIAAISIALSSAPNFAQEQTADAAIAGMSQLGIETEGLVLTEDQVLQVTAILSDASLGDAEKTTAIETLLGM